MGRTAADKIRPVVDALLGVDPPVQLRCWDGSRLGDPDATVRLELRSPTALRRLLWNPGELGFARA